MKRDAWQPVFLPVRRRSRETSDVVTLEFDASDASVAGDAGAGMSAGVGWNGFAAGQFNMLYAFGVGEIPVSLSGDPADPRRIVHTVRGVGPVSRALAAARRGRQIGLRGPYGSRWPLQESLGRDVLIVAGGLGLAPLRPVLLHVLRHRASYGRVALLCGARTPQDLLFRRELDGWRRLPGLQVRVAVDRAGPDWEGDVGVVTRQFAKVRFDPLEAIAMVCGPEIMIRAAALALENLGVEADRVHVSMERNMQCAIGQCGHCQFGPRFVCRDGPVFAYSEVAAMMAIREL
jgi:NAD(P)H-flavin reductase